MMRATRVLPLATLALAALLVEGGTRSAAGAGALKVRASEAFAPCLEPALAAFTRETGIPAVLEVGEPDPPGDADVVVGDDAELTRLLEGPGLDYTTTVDLGTLPWVLVVPRESAKADVAASLTSADRVVVLGGRVGRDALSEFKGMPAGRSRFSRDRSELREASYTLVPRSLAGPGEQRPAGVRPLMITASMLRAASHPEEARSLLAYLKGRGRPACFDVSAAAGVKAQAAVAAQPYAAAVVDWWLPDCTLRSNQNKDPQTVLGAPDAVRLAFDSYTGMFSLGQGGYVTVDMGASAIDGPGADIRVFQTTSIEPVSLYASTTAQGPFTLIAFRRACGERSPGILSGHCDFDLAEGRMTEARYFKIEDGEIFPCLAAGTVSEGADIDAVQILNQRP